MTYQKRGSIYEDQRETVFLENMAELELFRHCFASYNHLTKKIL